MEHIEDNIIVEWLDSLLADSDREKVESHLENCAECRLLASKLESAQDEARLADLLSTERVPPELTVRAVALMEQPETWLERIENWAGAALDEVAGALVAVRTPALGFARGAAANTSAHYRADGVDVAVSVHEDEGGAWILSGNLLDPNDGVTSSKRGVRARLEDVAADAPGDELGVHIADLNRWGEFVIEGVEPGVYTVAIAHRGRAIVISGIDVGLSE